MTAATWAVTGAAGYLGSHVTEQLVASGARVVAVDDLSSGRADHIARFVDAGRAMLERVDVRDEPTLRDAFVRYKPQCVVHLAAVHFIPAAIADPARAVSLNVHGTQCVLSAARAADVPRFWFASTGDVYAPAEVAHREGDLTKPFNIYGLTKLMGEQLVAMESQLCRGAHMFVGRLFNLYGPRETNPHFLPELLSQIKADPERPLRLGNLFPKRDLVPVADAARAVIASAKMAPAGFSVMNVASGVAHSMQQVVDMINEALGGRMKVETDPDKVRPTERSHLQADVSRLRDLIGWTPHADLRRGLHELLVAEGLL